MAEDKKNKEGEEEGSAESSAPKKKSKKGLFIGLGIAVLLIAIGVPLAIFMTKEKKEEPKSAEKVSVDVSKDNSHKLSTEAEEELQEGEEILGAIAPLDAFVVNLRGGRFIRVQVQLEFVERDVPKRLFQRAAIVRDAIITLLTTKSAEEMLDREGKEKLRKEIRSLVNESIRKELVKQVYFTQFVVQ
jgi:flagellar protein FliL